MNKQGFLISLKNDKDYEMYSNEGNIAVHNVILKIVELIFSKERLTLNYLLEFVGTEMQGIYSKHEEILDSEPRFYIQDKTVKALTIVNYDFGEFEVDSKLWDNI